MEKYTYILILKDKERGLYFEKITKIKEKIVKREKIETIKDINIMFNINGGVCNV